MAQHGGTSRKVCNVNHNELCVNHKAATFRARAKWRKFAFARASAKFPARAKAKIAFAKVTRPKATMRAKAEKMLFANRPDGVTPRRKRKIRNSQIALLYRKTKHANSHEKFVTYFSTCAEKSSEKVMRKSQAKRSDVINRHDLGEKVSRKIKRNNQMKLSTAIQMKKIAKSHAGMKHQQGTKKSYGKSTSRKAGEKSGEKSDEKVRRKNCSGNSYEKIAVKI